MEGSGAWVLTFKSTFHCCSLKDFPYLSVWVGGGGGGGELDANMLLFL